MASPCRAAMMSGVVLLCLGCTSGPGSTERGRTTVSVPPQDASASQAALATGPTDQRSLLDRMDASNIQKATAYQQGNSSIIRQTGGTSGGSSMVQSISTGFKDGVSKVGDFLTPEAPVKRSDDPTSLMTKAKPTPELYVATARWAEQSGKVDEAERQYEQALKLAPEHLEALVGLGRLRDRQGRLDEAIQFYQKALTAHPGEAVVHNDLGLCYARKHMYPEAVQALQRSVQLQPTRALYRNNLAMVLVETGDNDSAFTQLAAVHGEAAACYNLGYLVYKKGQYELAAKLFAKALEKDPSLVQARPWLQQAQAALAGRMPSGPSQNAAVSVPPPSQPMPRSDAPASEPAGIAVPSGRAPEAAPVMQARRPLMVPNYPTRQLPAPGQGAGAGQSVVAPMPPSLSSDGAAPAGQRLSGRSNAAEPALIAPLPPVTRGVE